MDSTVPWYYPKFKNASRIIEHHIWNELICSCCDWMEFSKLFCDRMDTETRKVTEWDYTVTEREHPNYLWPDGITLKYLWPNGNIQTFYDWTELHCARMGTLELFVTGWNYFSTVCDWMELEWLNGINTPTFVTGWEFSLLFIKPRMNIQPKFQFADSTWGGEEIK